MKHFLRMYKIVSYITSTTNKEEGMRKRRKKRRGRGGKTG